MAEDEVNEEQWLYGDSNPDKSNDAPGDDNLYGDKFDNSLDSNAALQPPPGLEPPVIEPPKNFNISKNLNKDNQDFDDTSGNDNEKSPDELNDKQNAAEEEEGEDGEVNDSNRNDADETSGAAVSTRNGDDDEDDDDDSEDDVNVVIGEIKTSSQYTIKRGGPLLGQQLKQPGKFSIEEFETIGTINGIPTHDFSLDSLEDKPWRKPGADITDYFNYGFNEETWRAYCERQKRMRVQESGVGLGQLSGVVQPVNQVTTAVRGNIPVTIVNDNSKYAVPPGAIAPTVIAPRKAGPPPGRRVGGTIDVLGNPNRSESPPKGNVIQVMTADRREYSRKTGFPDMSIPPPTIPPPGFDPGFGGTEYGADYYNSEMDPYYQAYEPTQDSQWANSGWDHDEIKVLSASYAPPTIPPHVLTSETSNQDSQDASDKSSAVLPGGVSIKQERDTSKERDRDRDRDRERDRDRSERDRERSDRHRSDRSHRHRSRSRSTERRSRKHKSRSRSPGHRSHKKKKSKKSDRSKEDSD